jgi:cell division protein FtsB
MMSKNGIILIAFAWAMEIVGVSGGIINSTYTTFGEDLPTTFVGYIPAVPMVALAVAELGRVPLASVIFHKHKLMQGVAILGIFALGYLAVENWTFGFERIVDLRLKPVNTTKAEVLRAADELLGLVDQRVRMTTSNAQKRDELRRGIIQRDNSIGGLTAQLSKEAEIHQKNLEEIREACRIIRDKCIVPRSQAEDTRYNVEVGRLSAELARQREERKQLQSEIDKLVSSDTSSLAELHQKIGTAEQAIAEARKRLRSAADGNQIYRLAASWYGVSTSDVTEDQFAMARWVFSTFSAVAVALAGSIAALVYYARTRVPGAPSVLTGSMTKFLRARRAYFARKRKPLKVEVPGPERVIYRDGKEPPLVVEKLVDRLIDHIVLIPRWGIWNPTYINSLIRSSKRNVADHDDPADSTSNVTQLKKKVN